MLTAVKNHMLAQTEMHLETLWRLIEVYPDNETIALAATMMNQAHTAMTEGKPYSTDNWVLLIQHTKAIYNQFTLQEAE